METIITIKWPLKRVPKPKYPAGFDVPLRLRWHDWLWSWGGGSVAEFGGSRVNTVRHLLVFRWHILTMHKNQFHDLSDAERAAEYLRKWSDCDKELRGLRLLVMGDSTNAEVKKVIRESLGIDLDEGTIL